MPWSSLSSPLQAQPCRQPARQASEQPASERARQRASQKSQPSKSTLVQDSLRNCIGCRSTTASLKYHRYTKLHNGDYIICVQQRPTHELQHINRNQQIHTTVSWFSNVTSESIFYLSQEGIYTRSFFAERIKSEFPYPFYIYNSP